MAKLLITRPHYDEDRENKKNTVKYLYHWGSEIIKFATEKAHKVIDITHEMVTKSNLEKSICDEKPAVIFFNGHGEEDTICGHEGEAIIIAGVNAHLLKKTIIYAISCKSAKTLGRECVDKHDTLSYIGYTDNFTFYTHPRYIMNPQRDPYAKLFLGPSNLLQKALLNGEKTGEAIKKAKEAFKKNIDFIGSITADAALKREMEKYLKLNRKRLILLGSNSVSI